MNRAGHRIDAAEVAARLAPPAPPCFDARDLWLRYLASSIEVQQQRSGLSTGPLALDGQGRIRTDRLNPAWSICTDCVHDQAERQRMQARAECQPSWWARHVEPLSADEPLGRTRRRTIPIHQVAG